MFCVTTHALQEGKQGDQERCEENFFRHPERSFCFFFRMSTEVMKIQLYQNWDVVNIPTDCPVVVLEVLIGTYRTMFFSWCCPGG